MEPLKPYRALDLTDEKGFFCGRILGDLGSDVVKIEMPGGEPARRNGPFYHDVPDPEKSLYWFAYNANKRGITLNIKDRDGQEIFYRLVKAADVVVESFPPGYMDNLGLGYQNLSTINPGLVMTSITPFGASGPYRDYKGTPIVVTAMGGPMCLCGDRDRPPVQFGVPQAYLNASGHAAVGTMIALYHREVTGEGQWVDVSGQISMVPLNWNALSFWSMNGVNIERSGSFRHIGPEGKVLQHQLWPCRDGQVIFVLYGGRMGAGSNSQLVEWMDSEGMADDYLKGIDWETYDMAKITKDGSEELERRILKFFLAHSKQELYEGALKRGMLLFPLCTVRDIADDIQLKARDFWIELEHPELDTKIAYPGPCPRCSEAPLSIRRRAPLIGEHNREIYEEELGLSPEELVTLKQKGAI